MIGQNISERLNSTDRAVSPVIGVILMVAITVILAAVIGTFVLDLGQSAGNSAPSASLTVTSDTNANNVTIAHKGGDTLNSGNTRVIIAGVTYNEGGSSAFGVGEEQTFSLANTGGGGGGSVINTTWTGLSSSATTTVSLTQGEQYDVQVIDTESQRVIFETTITA